MSDTYNAETAAAMRQVIRDFDQAHPRGHSIARDGEYLICRDCDARTHAPVPPKPPLTPMESSLSRFD